MAANQFPTPAEVRIRTRQPDGTWQTTLLNATLCEVNITYDEADVPAGWNDWRSYYLGENTITLTMRDAVREKPADSLAVQMALAVLDGDQTAALALADAIIHDPQEAFACKS